ncbi:Ig-like domain-containing protein [Roseomonas sp. HJA6]|uniref:Ig-like domain-containing protein n=1 Tax=Roseomonas alba TaxID=2846776 RepID=A0ABS7AHB3_9PROT|nr:Ig-like domain-containing protein [Neoroseomonas alba]MBW6401703.1 Ig-like domain-containing protein [Neoroseomonas alba]
MSEQHVVFVGIDGIQLEQMLLLGLRGEAEALNSLDIVEAYTGGVQGTETEQPTVSGPGWSTLLTGVWTNQHGVTSNNGAPVASEVDSVFELVDAGLADANIASIVHWDDINTGHFSAEVSSGVIDTAMSGLSDQAVTDEAVALIDAGTPDFMFLQLDDVDGAGHNAGFGEGYEDAINTVSAQLAQILAAVDAREAANPDENWLVVVSTDHGRDPNTGSGHGNQTDMERRSFIAANQDLGSFSDPVPVTSVVSTILDFLGIPFTVSADGLQSGSVLEGAADPLPPAIEAFLTPVDDQARVGVDTDLSLRFSEAVQVGTGAITIRDAADDSIVAVIDVTSDAVSIAGDTVTITLPEALAAETSYYVLIDEGAFTDGTNGFFGISDPTAWNFSTEADLSAPEIVALTPADDADAVPVDADLTITFNEAVIAGEGNIVIRRVSDDSVVETVSVTSDAVTIDGRTVTIDLPGLLEGGVEYYVQVDEGALRDTSTRVTLFTEDFESVALGPFVSPTEGGGDGTDFNGNGPDGWTRDNTTTPTGGPLEFFGWTVLDKNSWIVSAGDQGRGQFSNASGAVLVADPDEYDDGAADVGSNLFNAYIKTPAISLTGIEAGTATVTFDSSWRAEGTQKAAVDVSYDGGATWTRVMLFDSDSSSAHYKADATNESITVALNNPEGASEAIIRFGMFEAGNNWWWAIDDIAVQGEGDATGTTGNAFAGIADKESWTFTTTPVEARFIEGTNGANTLVGDAGNDTIYGYNAADSLVGAGGNDSIGGGNGNDTLDGGTGNDRLEGHGSNDVLFGGEGDDTLSGGNNDDLLKGDQGDDFLEGGNGSDTLEGGEGDDLMLGRAGTDTLLGGAGADTLDGGGGRDLLAGGQGADVLTGGLGRDIFAFGAAGGDDVVSDFALEDWIRLEGGITIASSEVILVDGDATLDTVLHFSDGGSVALLGYSAGVEQIAFA